MSQNDQEEVQNRAAAIKSAMMELERKRIEAVKRRQEKELERLVEGEKKMSNLQEKILQMEEEEIKKRKAHEKEVEEHRRIEIEKAKER